MPMENTSMTSLAPHFESILDTLSDGVFISDAEGTTLFVNKMYESRRKTRLPFLMCELKA